MKRRRYIMVKKVMSSILAAVILLAVFAPMTGIASYADSTVPTPVAGKVLTKDKTGDVSDWVEIARYEGYSLIVRANFINTYANKVMGSKTLYNDPAYQYTTYGAQGGNYSKSLVRDKINAWFNGTAKGDADKLPADARLRAFSVQANPLDVLGTSSTDAAVKNGYSIPTAKQADKGDDVAFALSYGESAQFLSLTRFTRASVANVKSSDIAAANFSKVSIPKAYMHGMWLRSPGDVNNTHGFLENTGRDFQMIYSISDNTRGLVYPAMWVGSGIFDEEKPTVEEKGTIEIIHRDTETKKEVAPSQSLSVTPGTYGAYHALAIPPQGYGEGTLAAGSAPAQGTIAANQSITIIYEYAKLPPPPVAVDATITVIHKDAVTGEELGRTVDSIPAGQQYKYSAKDFIGYEPGVLAVGSDPNVGTAASGQKITITYNYVKIEQLPEGMARIIVNYMDSFGRPLATTRSIIVPAGLYNLGELGLALKFDGYMDYGNNYGPEAIGYIIAGETLTIVCMYHRL
jgi:hypothetical protein